MSDPTHVANPAQAAVVADAGAPPPPPTTPQLYDAARNKKWGVPTIEEIEVEFGRNPDGLAARIRHDKTRRQKKTWDDVTERAAEGVRMKVLKESVKGTGRSTELMVSMTGYKPPTTQTRIHLGEFFPWAAPRLQLMMEHSQVEREPGTGVGDFETPPERAIIEMGQEEAKKAGCWGLPQVLMIGAAGSVVEAADLPRNIGWKEGRRSPHPWWKRHGALVRPWDGYVLYVEVREPGEGPDLQPAWSLDLLAGKGGEATVTFRGRGFVARSVDGALASAADALDQFKPHVCFLPVQNAEGAEAEPAGRPFVAEDKTGKRHLTLDDIAGRLATTPGALGERLRGQGYLNLQGEATPAALDAGITRIVGGGTQFCLDAIKSLLDGLGADRVAPDESVERDRPVGGADAGDGTAGLAAAGDPVGRDRPAAETDPADGTVGIVTTGEPGERDQPTVKICPAAQPVDVPAEPEGEGPGEAADATGRATVRRAGGMQRVTGRPEGQPATDGDGVDQPATGPAPKAVPDVAHTEAGGGQAAARLGGGLEALLAAERAMGRRTEEGEFVPHPGDGQTLRNRIKTAAEAMAGAYATLAGSASAYQALLTSVDALTMKAQRLASENAELKRLVQEQRATIAALEQASAEHAEVVPFRAPPGTEDGSATAAAH